MSGHAPLCPGALRDVALEAGFVSQARPCGMTRALERKDAAVSIGACRQPRGPCVR